MGHFKRDTDVKHFELHPFIYRESSEDYRLCLLGLDWCLGLGDVPHRYIALTILNLTFGSRID